MATPLDHERYVNLETFRKDGTGVKTPLWAAPLDGKLVFCTGDSLPKVKRIRNDARIRVAACNASGKVIKGPWYGGTARVIEGAQAEKAEAALARKYGLTRRLFYLVGRLLGRVKPSTMCWIEITVDGPAAT